MSEDRLRRGLESAEEPRQPEPDFAAALFHELKAELGFAPTARVRGATRRVERPRWPVGRGRRWPLDLLLVAALVATATIGLIGVAGALHDRLTLVQPSPDLLAVIRGDGRMRIAIRPDYPQFTISGQPAAGFDADVAAELAARLGISAQLVIVDVSAMLSPGPGAGLEWDVALPSVAAWTLDPLSFQLSSPYYRWPHRLIVPAGSSASELSDVTQGPICAVVGDAGEAWLQGRYGTVAAGPITTAIVTRTTDDGCLSALASGTAQAAVTAHLSDADLRVRADIRVLGGPAAEPRVVIVRQQHGAGPDPSGLLHAIDDALAAMRADGTLARLSESRFGGANLTVP